MNDDGSNLPTWIGKFSPREEEILALISEGFSNQEISRRLYLSLDTIKWYNRHLFQKLGAKNRLQAVKMASLYGLLPARIANSKAESAPHNHNLPSPMTVYVGREKEIESVRKMLTQHRLVTLTGTGGTGKTRLALQVAEKIVNENSQREWPDGVWWVDLSSLNDPEQVLDSIARIFDLNMQAPRPVLELLIQFLANKRLLLLLDNFEHLLARAPQVFELLRRAPRLVILATSRERLGIYGEAEFLVQPFDLPDPGSVVDTAKLMAYDAIRLFIQRAQAVRPNLEINSANLAAAARVCLRLDGLPLAIELAAAQVKWLSLPALIQRLENSSEWLAFQVRGLPSRQRTLQASIAWSINRLSVAEKRLLSRLIVFTGGASLESLKAISGEGTEGNLLGLLAGLVDKNLVIVRDDPQGMPRFSMLQTIQEFVRQMPVSPGESEALRLRYATYFVEFSEQYRREIHGKNHLNWNERVLIEQDNLQSALVWCLGQKSPDSPEPARLMAGLRIMSALATYWHTYGRLRDRQWAECAVAYAHLAPPDLCAGTLYAAGVIYITTNDTGRAIPLMRQAMEAYQQLGQEHEAAWALWGLCGASFGISPLSETIDLASQSLAAFRKFDDRSGISYTLTALGESARMQGDYGAAREYYLESLAISIEIGERSREAVQYHNLSFVYYHLQNYDLAFEYIHRALELGRQLGVEDLSTLFTAYAGIYSAIGQPARAAQLLGTAQSIFDQTGYVAQPADLQEYQAITRATRLAMTEKDFEAAWQAGYRLTRQQALALAGA